MQRNSIKYLKKSKKYDKILKLKIRNPIFLGGSIMENTFYRKIIDSMQDEGNSGKKALIIGESEGLMELKGENWIKGTLAKVSKEGKIGYKVLVPVQEGKNEILATVWNIERLRENKANWLKIFLVSKANKLPEIFELV